MVSVSAVWVAVVTSSVSVTGISVSVSWVSVSISAIVSFWFSISFGFTLVQLVDSISGSWGAYVLVGSSSGKSVWGISVWSISITVWGIGTIEYSWVSISRSLATVSSISISISVVWVSITVSMAIVSTISVASISKTISIRAIVSFGGCFGFWFSNNGCDEAQGEYGKFHHFEYELFELNPHKNVFSY